MTDHEKYEITLTFENFEEEMNRLVKEKKSMIVFMFGSKSNGMSWCPDCVKSEPFVEKMKPFIFENEKNKEVLFVNVPMDRDKRQKYKENKILNAQRVPTLAYFMNGKEMGRIIEGEMDTMEKVEGFIKQIYE